MADERYVLITADTHAGGSHDQYRFYLDPTYREAFDEWRGGYRNPAQKHYGRKKKRNWDLAVRTEDQNGQGVVGEVVFPNTVPPFYKKSIVTASPPRPEEFEHCLAGIRAHNRWLVDFCAEDPLRRAGIGLILPNDFEEAIKDIEFIANAGLRGGVLLPLIPDDCPWLAPLYDPSWDRVFAAIQDCGLVMNQHSGQGSPSYREGLVGDALWIQEVHFFCRRGFSHLIMGGAFERFPKLRYILTESGCSWAPETLAQLDRIHAGVQAGAIGEMVYDDAQPWVLKDRPSDYAARNCWYGASFPTAAELQGIEEVGEDRVCWGNDYPHYEGTFPYNLESLRVTFGGMPEVRRRKLLGENAAQLYGFDLEALRPLAAQHGPTAAEIDAPLARDEIPTDSACQVFHAARAAASKTDA
jgi:predicted TIM-barrel fold metal-dependent hydrolase